MALLLKMELKKAFGNPWFSIAFLVGTFLALVSAAGNVMNYLETIGLERMGDKYYPPYISNAFGLWMSVSHKIPTSTLFFKLAPLLAAIPYGWSLASELSTGYANQIFSSVSKGKYLFSKCVAAFVAGGLVVVAPQVINFVFIACFVPMHTPVISDAMYLGIFHDNLFSYLFYNIPSLYVAAYLILDFILCGIWAVFVLSLASFVRNRIVLLTAPYLFLLIVQFVNERIFLAMGGLKGMQLSLFENLQAHTNMYVQSWDIILAEAVLLVVALTFMMYVTARKDML